MVMPRPGAARFAALAGVCLAGLMIAGMAPASGAPASAPVIVDGAIETPLSSQPGDAERGREIVADRRKGLCLLCHSGPFPQERFQGDIAPSLAGAGSRNTPAQLRARMVDSRMVAPGSLMPAYYAANDLARVAPQFAGKTILSAQDIEDIVAFLSTLKE